MTLDCTSLKRGDKVRLRNGSIHAVREIYREGNTINSIHLSNGQSCYRVGQYDAYEDCEHDLDIVKILPKQRLGRIPVKPKTTYEVNQPMNTTTLPFSWSFALGTLELNNFIFTDPTKITINGKQYVPAKGPNLCYPLPYKLIPAISPFTNEVVEITCDGKRFTSADSLPEPITNRPPTKEDANEDGRIQVLDIDGDWMRKRWDDSDDYCVNPYCGWVKTSDWKPRPISKKVLLLRDLKQARDAGIPVTHGALDAAIELLEETP